MPVLRKPKPTNCESLPSFGAGSEAGRASADRPDDRPRGFDAPEAALFAVYRLTGSTSLSGRRASAVLNSEKVWFTKFTAPEI